MKLCAAVGVLFGKMKSTTSLVIVDCRSSLDAQLMARIAKAAALCPLQVPDKQNPFRIRADWRDLLPRFVSRMFPHAWIYRGGRHIAVHASPPRKDEFGRVQDPEAGVCLFRIVESSATR